MVTENANKEVTKKPRRKFSTQEYKEYLLKLMSKWVEKDGLTAEQAVEKLTMKQFDFLVNQNVDTDQWLLSAEQIKASKQTNKVGRRLSPEGYKKKYPEEKQRLYKAIIDLVCELGAEIQPKEKENFRELDFTINGKKYRIVLSNPRK